MTLFTSGESRSKGWWRPHEHPPHPPNRQRTKAIGKGKVAEGLSGWVDEKLAHTGDSGANRDPAAKEIVSR